MRFRYLLLASAIFATAPALAASAPRYGTWGVDTADMDTSVKPGDDFFN